MTVETTNFKKNAEALHIKHERPTLNGQEQPVPLKWFD